MKRIFAFSGFLALVCCALVSNANAAEQLVIPTCQAVPGCINVGYDLASKQCLYNCG